MFEFDELKIYRGNDIEITPKIIVTQPTIGQIEEFGEKRYFNAVYTLTAVGADLKWQLWDYGQIDYTQIEDYDLFIKFISSAVSSKKHLYNELMNNKDKYENELSTIPQEVLDGMLINPLQLILKDIDFDDFTVCKLEKNDQIVLYDQERDITIDRLIYSQIVDAVRKIHGLKRNNQRPANERTKMDLIEDARDEAMAASKRPYKSTLKPLVSALTVKCGLCGDDKVWNMKINAFFDSIKRIGKMQDAQLLLQGAYSGFASLKGVDKERLDWAGDI
nr:MAG TPA: hypothetical protein [Caudoviricetes sp.]